MERTRVLGFVLGIAAGLPAAAHAGNGLEPRTPVDWPEDTACLTVVDRTRESGLHLSYGIPFEDPVPTADEVADSRRHQFLAFCRDHSREEFLPIWLSWKDIEAAAAKDIVDPMTINDDEVLETSTVWKDCWFRITPDDARKPITFAEAAKGADWDTSALPAGAYVVQGYTWEPSVNIYSQRPGIVHIVDGTDLAPVGPAAAITTRPDFTFAEDTFLLEGCARALPGSTLSGYWAITGKQTLDWLPFVQDVALDGESFALPFLPPPEAAQETVALRIDVVDPMQRTFSAYPPNLLTILPGSSMGTTSECEPEASFIATPCMTGGTSESGSPMSTTTGSSGAIDSSGPGSGDASVDASSAGSTTTGAELVRAEDGCSCVTTSAPSHFAWASLVLFGWRRRARRGVQARAQVKGALHAPATQ